MCRCVDFGSTNTSFRRVRVIGGVSPVDCETASASWLTLHRGGSDVNSPGEGLSPICGVPMASVTPISWIFPLTRFGPLTSMPSRSARRRHEHGRRQEAGEEGREAAKEVDSKE